jgi:hypothetical protein
MQRCKIGEAHTKRAEPDVKLIFKVFRYGDYSIVTWREQRNTFHKAIREGRKGALLSTSDVLLCRFAERRLLQTSSMWDFSSNLRLRGQTAQGGATFIDAGAR